ncbi:MAG: DUF721 domain-containing protein [Geodermatophilaceae bacterium]
MTSGESAASGSTPGDLARAAMQAAARTAKANPGARPRRVAGRRRENWSSAGPDPTDPQPLKSLVGRLVDDRGWGDQAREGTLFGRWPELVGPQIAAHCRPEQLRDGELLVVADTSAWATQLRLLVPKLQARLVAELGSNLIRRIRVQGPVAPTRYAGPRRFKGRGLRDTFG